MLCAFNSHHLKVNSRTYLAQCRWIAFFFGMFAGLLTAVKEFPFVSFFPFISFIYVLFLKKCSFFYTLSSMRTALLPSYLHAILHHTQNMVVTLWQPLRNALVVLKSFHISRLLCDALLCCTHSTPNMWRAN